MRAPSRTKSSADTSRPDDINRVLHNVMQSIEKMRIIYAEENAALKAADTKKFMAMQDRKISVARDYQACVSILLARKDELKGRADPKIRQILIAKHKEFSTLCQENLEELERMRGCVQRLGNRIMQAARDLARKDTHSYGAQGHMAHGDRRVSMGLNESA